MVERATQDGEPADLRTKAERFLGSLSARNGAGHEGDREGDDEPNREDARRSDARAIDPIALASDAPKRRGRGKWTAEQHAAARARRSKAGTEPSDEAQEKLDIGPPDPTIVGFAAEGLGFLNIVLASRFDAPEFAGIPREGNETVARGWLKFIGYYVSIAKATGPMGALAAACMTTAFVYGPPTVMAMRRPRAAPASPSGEGAETMFAPVMPPA